MGVLLIGGEEILSYILGVHGGTIPGWTHDPSACLVKDGLLIAAAEEERFIRVKHASGRFPVNAVRFCLERAGITLEDVDYIAIPWDSPFKSAVGVTRNYIEGAKLLRKWGYAWSNIKQVARYLLERGPRVCFRKFLKVNPSAEIVYVNHHIAHAASAFYCSGFDKSLIFTADNKGEVFTTTIGYADREGIHVTQKLKWFDSLGLFYGAFTEWFGFRMSNGEGKFMAAACYDEPSADLSDVIDVKADSSFKLNLNYFYEEGRHYTKELVNKFGPPRDPKAWPVPPYSNVAAAVQRTLEETAIKLVDSAQNGFTSRRLCIGGGVGLNCHMNMRLRESGLIDDIFIQPAANDAGTSVGAALEVAAKLGYKPGFRFEHVFWGPSFDEEDIEKSIKRLDLKYERNDDIAGVASELIAKGKIVGWFQGRMELGPRALGNRSLLADPRDMKMKDIVNLKVKHREPWRPFAPTMLAEAADDYFENPYPSPFMILAFRVKPERVKEIPAVLHVDGTTRPQTLERRIHPLYYDLIKEFERLTGIPMVLNTSFNDHGEPIVCTPQEAINDFLKTGMNYLVLGNFLLRK